MPNTLTAGQISALKTPGLHRVDRGLYVQVRPNGAKSWIHRFTLRGKARAMGLGPVRVVTLTEARAKAVKAERMRLDGEDPIDVRRGERVALMPAKAVPTFKECAEAYIEGQRAGWKNEKHAYQWTQSLTSYAFPTIGERAVTAVTLEDVVTILKPIWTTKSETAGHHLLRKAGGAHEGVGGILRALSPRQGTLSCRRRAKRRSDRPRGSTRVRTARGLDAADSESLLG